MPKTTSKTAKPYSATSAVADGKKMPAKLKKGPRGAFDQPSPKLKKKK